MRRSAGISGGNIAANTVLNRLRPVNVRSCTLRMGQRRTGEPRGGLQKREEADCNRLQLDLAERLEAKAKRVGLRLSEGTDRASVQEAHGHTTFFRLGAFCTNSRRQKARARGFEEDIPV